MPRCIFIAVSIALFLWAGAAGAADLTKVDRTIKKEPAYQAKPKYCLLAFGPDAKHRVWLVVDGDTLYVDRNANGDLTEAGERIKAPAFVPSTHPLLRERSIEAGDISVGGLTHTGLVVSQAEYERGVVYGMSVNLDPKCYGLFPDTNDQRVKHHSGIDGQGQLAFGDSPQNAPVVHFGGPLTLSVRPDEKFRRGTDHGEVSFWLGTAGLGPGTFATTYHDLLPKDRRPQVEIRFPSKEPGQLPVTWKYVLRTC
jgi:hypothetical protein